MFFVVFFKPKTLSFPMQNKKVTQSCFRLCFQHREMKYKHAEVMMAMSRNHFQAELEVYKRHHNAIYEALLEVMAANHNCHRKALEEIHDRDVVELKKAMDPQLREHMKQLAKKHKDKQELSRWDTQLLPASVPFLLFLSLCPPLLCRSC